MIPIFIRGFLLIALLTLGEAASRDNTAPRATGQRWNYRPRSKTSRPIPVAAHSRPLYRLYLPNTVSESVVMENGTNAEATIEFSEIRAHQLDNLTQALLNIVTIPNSTFLGEGWTWKLIGMMTGNSDNATSSSTTIGDTFPSNTLSFNVSQYLRSLTQLGGRGQRGQSDGRTTREWMYSIRLVFKVRRPCFPQFCQPFLDTGLRLPFLKVDYILDVDPPRDSDVQGVLTGANSRVS